MRDLVSNLLLLVCMVLTPAAALAQHDHSHERDGAAHADAGAQTSSDSAYSGVQARGGVGMGVDQYASTHRFDSLPDGGRIEYLMDSDDAQGIAQIRSHLQEIVEMFTAGDFSTPAFVHAQDVPGTATMARLQDRIRYSFRDLPRGGEVRIESEDAEALRAIHEFMAFQRMDHRAEGHAH